MIVQMAGLPGTGKTTLATALAEHLDGLRLDKDAVRHALFGPHHTAYRRDQDDFCVQALFTAAEWHLSKHPDAVVILDGRTCSRRYQIDEVRQFAARVQQPLHIIECFCSDDTARARIEATADLHPAANRNFTLHQSLKVNADPIPEPKIPLNTEMPHSICVQRCLDALRAPALCRNDPC